MGSSRVKPRAEYKAYVHHLNNFNSLGKAKLAVKTLKREISTMDPFFKGTEKRVQKHIKNIELFLSNFKDF